MDEALEVVELLADLGLEETVSWVFRLLGVLAVLAGVGLWLLADVTIIVPAALIIVGLLLLLVPEVLLQFAEVAG